MQEWWWQTDNTLGSHLNSVVVALGEVMSDRKIRLFSAACCRMIWDDMQDERLRAGVEIAEQFADELVSEDARCEAWLAVDAVLQRDARRLPRITDLREFNMVYAVIGILSDPSKAGVEDVVRFTGGHIQSQRHVNSLRDIFGNPFRLVAFDPMWRTSTAVALAKQMYDSREFSAMPILADALQDAGCDHDDILNHCRDANGIHVRGCWVVDLVLGKA
jgi:hypothetical protein